MHFGTWIQVRGVYNAVLSHCGHRQALWSRIAQGFLRRLCGGAWVVSGGVDGDDPVTRQGKFRRGQICKWGTDHRTAGPHVLIFGWVPESLLPSVVEAQAMSGPAQCLSRGIDPAIDMP